MYVLFHDEKNGSEVYWSGDFTKEFGQPCKTKSLLRARTFDSARQAYTVAGFYGTNLQHWKVGQRS